MTDGFGVIEPLLEAAKNADVLAASGDCHPSDHTSFEAHGGIWPPHCVRDTRGAMIHPKIRTTADIIVLKATTKDVDAYSSFDGTDLAEHLRERGVTTVIIGGIATDYCVKATVLSALEEGFKVIVLLDGCRGVNVQPNDSNDAILEMTAAGAVIKD